MAPLIYLPLTDDMAGALRATLNTRLAEVERHLRVVPTVEGEDLREVFATQLRTLLDALQAAIAQSLTPIIKPNQAEE